MSRAGRLTVIALVCVVLSVFTMAAGAVELTETTTVTYPVGGVREISISTGNGSVDVVAYAGDSVRVEVTGGARSFSTGMANWLLKRIRVKDSFSAGCLRVEVDLPGFFWLGSASAKARAFVPVGWRGELKIVTSNGSINVAELAGTGDLRTSNGAVHVGGWSGTLNVNTSNGRVEAYKLALTGNSDIRTSNGGLDLQILDMSARLDVRTSNGNIKVNAAPDLQADLNASLSNGAITVRGFGVDSTSTRQSYSAMLNGGGPDLTLRTSNGAITVEAAASATTPGGGVKM